MRVIQREESIAFQAMLVVQTLIISSASFGFASGANGGHAHLYVIALLVSVNVLALLRVRAVVRRRIRRGEAAERERERLLSSDALTEVLSRRSFLAIMKQRIRGDMSANAALLLVDVDHFKSINDTFGHSAGDQVLQHLVDAMRRHFESGQIGRLGGDEFAVLAAAPGAIEDAERFLVDLRQSRTLAGRSVDISASIGIAFAPNDASSPEDLVAFADLALYESKGRGRGCVTAFDRSMTQEQSHRRFVERELRAAILLDELELHYQPLRDSSGTVVAYEALVRWRHSIRGLISPGEFIPIAEQSSLIDMLGEWVLRRAVRDGRVLDGKRIGINVSGAQLKRYGFVEMVESVLAETSCSAERLVFEITESVALAATPTVLSHLQALRDMGAKVSIDDFGTGNSGFQSLRSLPIDSVKIDRSYIQGMGRDPVASVLVSALGSIGRIQDLAVVAEGIETEEHRTLALAAGCTLFQGFMLGRPQPLATIVAEREAQAA